MPYAIGLIGVFIAMVLHYTGSMEHPAYFYLLGFFVASLINWLQLFESS